MTLIDRFQNKNLLTEALLAQAVVQGDREVAAALADAERVVEFAAGEVLISEDATDRDMYLLLLGKVGVSVKGKYLYAREKNVTVGEMPVVNPLIARSATITAVEPTVALKDRRGLSIAPGAVHILKKAIPSLVFARSRRPTPKIMPSN